MDTDESQGSRYARSVSCVLAECCNLLPPASRPNQIACTPYHAGTQSKRRARERMAADLLDSIPPSVRHLRGLERQIAARAYLKANWRPGPFGVLRTKDLSGYALAVWQELDAIDEQDEARGDFAYYSPDVSDYCGPPCEPTKQLRAKRKKRALSARQVRRLKARGRA